MSKAFLAAMFLFYWQFSGEHYAELVKRNIGLENQGAQVEVNHGWYKSIETQRLYVPAEVGDIDGNDITNMDDLALCLSISPECFTLGGKYHLFEDCRHIRGKLYKSCECEPNNVCLTCVARKLKEN